jgi:hypothetical protein
MRKALKIVILAVVMSLLALTGCAAVAGQAQGNNSTTVSNPTDPIQAPPLEDRLVDFPEFLSVVGTISDIEEVDSNVSLVGIFWTEEIHGSDGEIAELPMHIYLHIDQDTVILADSEIQAGMFVTAVYRAPTREQQLSPNETLSAVAISDQSLKVARFDENWMYYNIRLVITDETEIVFQDGSLFDGEIDELQGRALVTIIGMSGTPVPGAENPIHINYPSKVVVLFDRDRALDPIIRTHGTPESPMSSDKPTYITIRGEQFRTDLTELILDNVPIDGHFVIGNALRNEDIVPLRYMTNLTILSLRGSHISDLAPLSSLTNLPYLNLNSNQISDITPLSGLKNLEHLDIRLNMISDLTPLTGLTNLTWLTLYGNLISDVSPLSELASLTHLGLWMNEINNISPLAELTNLTRLNLSGNRIQNLAPLSGLTNLTELWLGDNRIRDITPLSGLVNLTELRLYRNQIANWSPVAHVDYVVGRP